MNKRSKILLIILIIIMIIGVICFIGYYNVSKKKSKDINEETYKLALLKLPQKLTIEECVGKGYFVITMDKIYNKDNLQKFINNTGINAKNRIEDKIRIVNYNYDGYPTIYDIEYKIFDDTYINENGEKVNKSGYILAKDATRNDLIYEDINVNTDIPGEFYSINLREDEDFNVAIISLSLYAEINQNKTSKEPYKDIEIARYLLTGEVINAKSELDKEVEKANQAIKDAFNSQVIENSSIQGVVELNRNGHIYIFNGQHFGEYGFEMNEYTSANINNKNQVCIDYCTLEKYNTSYIEEGDILICTGNFKKNNSEENDFDTQDNPIIVLKAKDYNTIKKEKIDNKKTANITIEEYFETPTGKELYIKYDISDKEYKLPFVLKFNITDNIKIKGNLKKGKKIKVKYKVLNVPIDELELKEIEVI